MSLLLSLLFVFLVFGSCEKEQVTPDVLSQADENTVLASSRAVAGPQPVEPCNCFLGVTATEANTGMNSDWRIILDYLDKFQNSASIQVGGPQSDYLYPSGSTVPNDPDDPNDPNLLVGDEMKVPFNPRRSSNIDLAFVFVANGGTNVPAMTVDWRVQCDHAPGGNFSGTINHDGGVITTNDAFGTIDFECIGRFRSQS